MTVHMSMLYNSIYSIPLQRALGILKPSLL